MSDLNRNRNFDRQSEARIHRVGCPRMCTVFQIVAADGSTDEAVKKSLQNKISLETLNDKEKV